MFLICWRCLSSQDIAFIDDVIPATFFDATSIFSYCMAIMVIVAIASPIVIAFLVVFIVVCDRLRVFYTRGSRQVRSLHIVRDANNKPLHYRPCVVVVESLLCVTTMSSSTMALPFVPMVR